MSKSDLAANSKPTVNDIARHAGVSLATVDRVLNARPGVRGVTIERVNKAISELGYIRDTAAANLARRRVYRFVFLLPETKGEFIDSLETQVENQSSALSNERTFLETKRVAAFDSQSIVQSLDELDAEQTDGVAILAPETPAVRDAIGRVRERGIIVVALVSDLPSSHRDHFVGIDNTSAGKTAAQLLGRFVKESNGSILLLTDSRLARDHLERGDGFYKVMSELFPQFRIPPSIEARDDSELLDRVLPNAFNAWPDIRGIYASLSSNQGLIEYLTRHSRDLVVVAHELTPLSRKALKMGIFDALISQNSGHIVRSAVRRMRATMDALPIDAPQERIRIEIYLKENLPSEP